MGAQVSLFGVPGLPLIETGDNLATLITHALRESGIGLQDRDVMVVTSKIISKAEGRWVDIETITPDSEALRVAEQCGKDPREVRLILDESVRVSRVKTGVLITQHKLGFTSANAGIDHSNTRAGGNWRLLLPLDPDRTAHDLRTAFHEAFGVTVAVILSDSHGRPFRFGTIGMAVGAAGIPALHDLRGQEDLFGEVLIGTEVGLADELAAAAGLVSGQVTEMLPVVVIRGLHLPVDEDSTAKDLVRPAHMDLYR